MAKKRGVVGSGGRGGGGGGRGGNENGSGGIVISVVKRGIGFFDEKIV